MPSPDAGRALPRLASLGWPVAIAAIAAGGIALAAATSWDSIAEAGSNVVRALPVLPAIVGLQLGLVLLSALGWRALFAEPGPGIAVFYRLRMVRQGVNALLPVARVGGEIVGARLLAQQGVAPSQAGASVIVDVTVELLTQIVFLVAGLCALGWLSQQAAWGVWIEAVLAGAAALGALLLAQRFGVLRALETLLRGMARRWPALGGASLDGLHAAALGFYRRPAAMLRSTALHLLAWVLGSIETWATLNMMGVPATPLQVFVVESLGMAARSAGFAIPAALGAQEGGFVLAAVAVGLPAGPALALSLVKRAREVLVGLVGLALWHWEVRRPAPL